MHASPEPRVEIIPILEDNYSYLVTYHIAAENLAFLVDPADPDVVLSHLSSLPTPPLITHIFTTHKHWDHAGGNKKVIDTLQPTQPDVVIEVVCGEIEAHPSTTRGVQDSDVITLPSSPHSVHCLHTPAHTNGHMCYYLPTLSPPVVFTGDCLFMGGCGKFFEGNPKEMMGSLKRLAGLPKEARVYPGHEYTVSNLEFAVWSLPGHHSLTSSLSSAVTLRSSNLPTIPSTIEYELENNVFVMAAVGRKDVGDEWKRIKGCGVGGGRGGRVQTKEEDLLAWVREAKDKGLHRK